MAGFQPLQQRIVVCLSACSTYDKPTYGCVVASVLREWTKHSGSVLVVPKVASEYVLPKFFTQQYLLGTPRFPLTSASRQPPSGLPLPNLYLPLATMMAAKRTRILCGTTQECTPANPRPDGRAVAESYRKPNPSPNASSHAITDALSDSESYRQPNPSPDCSADATSHATTDALPDSWSYRQPNPGAFLLPDTPARRSARVGLGRALEHRELVRNELQ